MPRIADDQNLITACRQAGGQPLRPADERTGGIDHDQAAPLRLRDRSGRRTMGTDDDRSRGLARTVHRLDPAIGQSLHHGRIVDQRPQRIDRPSGRGHGLLGQLDGAFDAETESGSLGQQHFHQSARRPRPPVCSALAFARQVSRPCRIASLTAASASRSGAPRSSAGRGARPPRPPDGAGETVSTARCRRCRPGRPEHRSPDAPWPPARATRAAVRPGAAFPRGTTPRRGPRGPRPVRTGSPGGQRRRGAPGRHAIA